MEDLKVTANGYDFKPAHAAMQRYVDGNLLSGISSAVHGRPRSGRCQLRRLGRQGSADAAPRRSHLPRLLQHQAGHLLRRAAAVRGRQIQARRSHREVYSAARKPEGAASRRRPRSTTPSRPRASITIRQLLSHSSGLSYGFFDPGTADLQGPQRARRPQSHDDAGADGRRAGRPAADLSAGHVVGILARHRRGGAAGRGHQRPEF